MTRDDFRRYFATLAPKMRLAHWHLDIPDDEPEDGGAWADVTCYGFKHGAMIRISEAILEESPENQRNTAVHELVHLFFAQHDTLIRSRLHAADKESWESSMEYAIDALTRVISAFMPLPEAPVVPEFPATRTPLPDCLWDEQ